MDEAYSYLDEKVISIEDVIASAESLARYRDLYAFRCKTRGCFAPVQACAIGANNVRRAYFAMHGDVKSVDRERVRFRASALASEPNEFSPARKYHRIGCNYGLRLTPRPGNHLSVQHRSQMFRLLSSAIQPSTRAQPGSRSTTHGSRSRRVDDDLTFRRFLSMLSHLSASDIRGGMIKSGADDRQLLRLFYPALWLELSNHSREGLRRPDFLGRDRFYNLTKTNHIFYGPATFERTAREFVVTFLFATQTKVEMRIADEFVAHSREPEDFRQDFADASGGADGARCFVFGSAQLERTPQGNVVRVVPANSVDDIRIFPKDVPTFSNLRTTLEHWHNAFEAERHSCYLEKEQPLKPATVAVERESRDVNPPAKTTPRPVEPSQPCDEIVTRQPIEASSPLAPETFGTRIRSLLRVLGFIK